MRWLILLFVLFFDLSSFSQDLTGKWIGKTSDKEYIELNIQANGRYLKGSSYDYELKDSLNYCRAAFLAEFDKKKKQLYVDGVQFISRGDSSLYPHTLMTLYLYYRKNADKEFLEGLLYPQNESNALPDSVWLMREVSTSEKINSKNEEFLPSKKKETSNLFNTRQNNIIQTITVKSRHIKIKLVDNEVYDADTVSIFLDGQPLLMRKEINYKPVTLSFDIPLENKKAELGLFAENLGTLPPNTALMIIFAGDDRFELKTVADLKRNAVIEIIVEE